MNTSVVVGIGGTGSWALAQLKQRLLADWHWQKLGEGLGVMSNPAVYDAMEWPVYLTALDVDKQKRPSVGFGVGLTPRVEDFWVGQAIGRAIKDIQNTPDADGPYSQIRPWLPQTDALKLVLKEADKFTEDGAAQIRHFGRLVFFLDVENNGNISSALSQALTRATNAAGGKKINVFVVASVAGGTGSGMLVDTLAFLSNRKREIGGENQPFKTTGFLVLPAGFEGVLAPDEVENTRANGMAALREIDRLMNAHRRFKVSWRKGDEKTLENPALDVCYLIDGSRDAGEEVASLARHMPFETGLPVAIADALYAHIFPTSAAALESIGKNLATALITGSPHSYSSFGTYSINYAWEPLMRSCAGRLACDVLDFMLADSRSAGAEAARGFVSGGAQASLSARGKNQDTALQQAVPAFVTNALESGLTASPIVVTDAWLYPASRDTADRCEVPSAPVLAEQFPGIGLIRTEYTNEQVRQSVGTILSNFWGPETGVWSGAGAAPWHVAVNTNLAEAAREWNRALAIACTALMNGNTRIGGISAALEFLAELEGKIDLFAKRLSDQGAVDLTYAQQRLQAATDAMNDGRSWDDAGEQKDYISASQELLMMELQSFRVSRAQRQCGDLLNGIRDTRQAINSWRGDLEVLRTQVAQRRTLSDDAWRTMDASPLQRHVPLPDGDPLTQELYEEGLGDEVTKGIRAAHTSVLDSMEWQLLESSVGRASKFALVQQGKNAWTEGDATPAHFEAASLEPFAGLRSKSIFEILRRSGESIDSIVSEMQKGAARLTSYDQGEQNRLADDPQHRAARDWDLYFAHWSADGDAGQFAAKLKDKLVTAGTSQSAVDLASYADEDGVTVTASNRFAIDDKIIAFSARHYFILDAFMGIKGLKSAYDARRDSVPSPHILPEEREAARIEKRSVALALEGLLGQPLNSRIAASEVFLCSDKVFMRSFAACVAAGLVRWQIEDAAANTGAWVLDVGEETTPLGTQPDLSEALFAAVAGGQRASLLAREAVAKTQRQLVAADLAAVTTSLRTLAANGWTGKGQVPKTLETLLQVYAAEFAHDLANA